MVAAAVAAVLVGVPPVPVLLVPPGRFACHSSARPHPLSCCPSPCDPPVVIVFDTKYRTIFRSVCVNRATSPAAWGGRPRENLDWWFVL